MFPHSRFFLFMSPVSPEIERAFQSVRLFETLYSSEINLLARAIETVHFNDKECIYRQGDPGDYYYLILKGRVNCQMQVCLYSICPDISLTLAQSSATSQNVTFREICTGQFFGEAALLSAKPRAATMVANGSCTTTSPFDLVTC
jgi:CRP-like cAMP-binding protein